MREERGWSQEQLAERVGCHRTHVTRIQAGQNSQKQRSNPHLDLIWDLADALGVDPGDLLQR